MPSHDVPNCPTPVCTHALVHSHQMSWVHSQKEVEMNDKDLVKKEREKK
jgi:hypothetical protein